MIGEHREKLNTYVHGEKIVNNFQYLGITVDERGTHDADINNRIQKTNKLYYAMITKFINKREMSKQTKIHVYKTIYRLILTFGCDSWILAKQQKVKYKQQK